MKHTQGEWEISHNNNQGIRIVTNPDNPIKTELICSLAGNPTKDEIHSNAKLIAAAPTQHEELVSSAIVLDQYIKSIHDGVYTKADQLIQMLENISNSHKQAIKKATE